MWRTLANSCINLPSKTAISHPVTVMPSKTAISHPVTVMPSPVRSYAQCCCTEVLTGIVRGTMHTDCNAGKTVHRQEPKPRRQLPPGISSEQQGAASTGPKGVLISKLGISRRPPPPESRGTSNSGISRGPPRAKGVLEPPTPPPPWLHPGSQYVQMS